MADSLGLNRPGEGVAKKNGDRAAGSQRCAEQPLNASNAEVEIRVVDGTFASSSGDRDGTDFAIELVLSRNQRQDEEMGREPERNFQRGRRAEMKEGFGGETHLGQGENRKGPAKLI